GAGLNIVQEPFLLLDVGRPHGAGEPKVRLVCYLERFFSRMHFVHGGDGPKCLFLHQAHILRQSSKYGRCIKIPGTFGDVATDEDLGPLVHRIINEFRKVVSAVSSSQWANLRLRIQWIADLETSHLLDERRGEFVVDVSVDNEAFAGGARLTSTIR